MKRWPLYLIAAPAAVAIWSGWVGLGGLCGFGPVRLLPGITGWTLNTAITLPVGVEAYAAYALGAWMNPASPGAARKFAKRSAIGALILGCAGQIVFHLLAASSADKAPWPVVVGVSCMPVIVLGFAAGLTHLLRAAPEPEPEPEPEPVPAAVPAAVPLPKVREIRELYGCSQATAEKIRRAMRTRDRVAAAPEDAAGAPIPTPRESRPPVLPDPGHTLNGNGPH